MSTISPLAPEAFPAIAQISGLELYTLRSGERYKERNDMLVALANKNTHVAGVFTQSLTPGAPVIWSRKVNQLGIGQAMIVTAGNANVCTGTQGLQNAKKMAAAVAASAGLSADQVYVSSTGVIGEQLKLERILRGIPSKFENSHEKQDWQAAAKAIMTTDTYPKAASTSLELDGKRVHISGIAKGSGMIEPNMATMLSYLFTDAAIEKHVLQAMLSKAVETTFNCITVDSDTSTSDTCLLFATGASAHAPITELKSDQGQQFYTALESLMKNLAHQIIKDGEGAQKFITVQVMGAKSNESAKTIARSIANSPLVKTAIAGEDANWGRIVMAVGKAGEEINFDALSVRVGNIAIAEGNGPLAGYDESQVQTHIEGREVNIVVNVGLGKSGTATIWTCDLTHAYIDINADYRS